LHFETVRFPPKGKGPPFDVKEGQNTQTTIPVSLRFVQGMSLLGVAADQSARSGFTSSSKGIVQ